MLCLNSENGFDFITCYNRLIDSSPRGYIDLSICPHTGHVREVFLGSTSTTGTPAYNRAGSDAFEVIKGNSFASVFGFNHSFPGNAMIDITKNKVCLTSNPVHSGFLVFSYPNKYFEPATKRKDTLAIARIASWAERPNLSLTFGYVIARFVKPVPSLNRTRKLLFDPFFLEYHGEF